MMADWRRLPRARPRAHSRAGRPSRPKSTSVAGHDPSMTPAPGTLALLGERSEVHSRGLTGAEATVVNGPGDDGPAPARLARSLASLLGRTVGKWISCGLGIAGRAGAPQHTLATEIGVTLAIDHRDGDGRIEARCSGRARLLGTLAAARPAPMEWEPDAPRAAPDSRPLVSSPERLEACGLSAVPLERGRVFAWLQVLDGRGRPMSDEVFLGHGPELRLRLHSRLGVEATPMTPDAGHSRARPRHVHRGVEATWLRLLHGVYARLLLRTYDNLVGPRFYVEALVLPLLPAGRLVRLSRPTGLGWNVNRRRRRAAAS